MFESISVPPEAVRNGLSIPLWEYYKINTFLPQTQQKSLHTIKPAALPRKSSAGKSDETDAWILHSFT
jgi:hypothetical protein